MPIQGSPPRVRSRRNVGGRGRSARGITSACAEQTWTGVYVRDRIRDHLRVCGADAVIAPDTIFDAGSPPRVRSRPPDHPGHQGARGITSACAEQTRAFSCSSRPMRDHLRVCGADAKNAPVRLSEFWITSACAEQTGVRFVRWSPKRDHLRVCGADPASHSRGIFRSGSPPRVRSRPRRPWWSWATRRITSACAEQTKM